MSLFVLQFAMYCSFSKKTGFAPILFYAGKVMCGVVPGDAFKRERVFPQITKTITTKTK